MSGSLVRVAENNVTSAVSSVTLTGIDDTFNVYKLIMSGVLPDTDAISMKLRFTVSGTPDTSSNYDRAFVNLRADTVFGDIQDTNEDHINIGSIGTAGNEIMNGIFYLYNFSDSGEFSFCSLEASIRNDGSNLRGFQGGAILTENQATDGVNFTSTSGNISSGRFVLYGIRA